MDFILCYVRRLSSNLAGWITLDWRYVTKRDRRAAAHEPSVSPQFPSYGLVQDRTSPRAMAVEVRSQRIEPSLLVLNRPLSLVPRGRGGLVLLEQFVNPWFGRPLSATISQLK